MKNKQATRRALLSSLLSLLLCCSMLLGTTFAWFTDSVTITGNIIKSGTLDVEMSWSDTNEDGTYKDASEGAIFDYKFWEPGYTQTKYVNIKNVGDLAFKYQLNIIPDVKPVAGAVNLADVIDVYMVDMTNAPTNRVAVDTIIAGGNGTPLSELMSDPDGAAYGMMMPKAGEGATNVEVPAGADIGEATWCIILHMQESADNKYQNLSVGNGFSVQLLATQLEAEIDSFGHDYDNESKWDVSGTGTASVVVDGTTIINAVDEDNEGSDGNGKVMTVNVPAGAVAEGVSEITANIIAAQDPEGFVVRAGGVSKTFDITVSGIKEGNTTDISVALYVGEGLSGVELYHKGTPVAYDEYRDGYIFFVTTSFSPFTVVFDGVATEEPAGSDKDLPVAIVDDADQYENVAIDWESYGSWAPDDKTQQLEAAYVFKAPHNSTTIADCAYKDWYCDYYVKLSCDLEEDSIFLGGNYGDFGWVGFDNGELTLEANTEIPLLGSVTSNPWTYEQVVNAVGEFICGVARANGGTQNLTGETFTVMLRLTNPADENEYYNVNTVEYTFAELADSQMS